MNPSLGQRLTQKLMSHRRPFSSQTRREKMENSPVAKCRYKLWFVVFALFVLWYLLLYVYNWSSFHGLTPLAIKTSESKNRIEYDDQKQAIEKFLEPSNQTFLAKNEAEHDHHDRENEEEPTNEVDKSHANSIKPSLSDNQIEYADQKQAIKKKLEPRNQTFLAKNEEAEHDHGRENEEEPIKEVDKSHANSIKPSVSKNRIEYGDQKQAMKKKLVPRNQTFLAKNEEAEHDHGREDEEEPIKEVDKSYANSIKPSVSKSRIEYTDQKQAIEKKLEPSNQTFLAKNEAEHDHDRENEGEPIKEVDKSYANSIEPSVSKNRIEYADQKQAIKKKLEPNNQTLLANIKAEHDGENEEDPIKGVEKDNWAKQATISSQLIVNNTIEPVTEKPSVDSCSGRYIYVHDIPSRFNDDLLKQCSSLDKWMNMCEYITNMGLGERNETTGWFATNQFTLELIFRNRMKQYECLTNDSSKASAIFVPFYAGLEISRHLFDFNASVRDSGSLDVVKWLREKPEWNVMYGRDHFLVAGRITWDFRRGMDDDKYWGNKLMRLPESKNMTMLTIESSPWDRNDFAIPYPTYFHPSSDNEVFRWQRKMRRQKRDFLFSFAGAPRPDREDSIRNEIIEQCQKAGTKCKFLRCTNFENKCIQPVYVMEIFQNSVFCLQPPGDSLTRRSTFDSILAGCIPVFFHPGSAYIQYLWHFPKNFTKYSVLIPEDGVKNRSVSIERVLRSIPKQKRAAMRKEVIKLIPKVTYADPRSKLKKFEDAFDTTVKGVLERVERLRKEIREGSNSSFDFDEEYTWKYNFFGIQGKHEWDHFFNRTDKGKKWQEGQQRE